MGLFGIDSVQSKVLEIIREGIVRDLIYENNIQILDKGEVKIMLATDRQTDRQTGYPSIDRPWLRFYSSSSFDEQRASKTVYQYVLDNNKKHMNTVAMKYKGKQISYESLIQNINFVAESIIQYGLKPGDRVMMAATGVPEVVYILLACSKLGICVEMINFSLDSESIKNHILSSEAKLVFCLDRIHEKIKEIIWKRDIETIVIPATQTLPSIIRFVDGLSHRIDRSHGKTLSYSEFLVKDSRGNTVTVNEEGQPYVVVYTSGTTGIPKGIVHTNRSYTTMAEEYNSCEYPFGRGDCFLNHVPFFIASALSFLTLASLMLGVTVILEPEYNPEVWLKDIVKYKPEVFIGTPSFWLVALENKINVPDLSFAKIVISGGEPLDIDTENRVNQWLAERGIKYKLTVGYGMSELNGTITTSSFKYHKAGSTGIPLPDVVVGVFDTDKQIEKGYNTLGELMAQSPCAMKEYANQPEKTAEYWWSDSQNRIWARTGDIGMIDENGEVYVYGRAIDNIVVEGKTVYFFEIENEIMKKETIHKCKVVISEKGRLKINLVAKEGVSNMEDSILSEIENSYGISLDKMECKLWDEFPLNANGKVDKIKLKKD